MNETTVSAMFDELEKIAIGLAPAGAPTVNSKGAGLAPKMPKLTGLSGAPGMPKMAEFKDFKSNPLHNSRRGAITLGLGSAAYSGLRHYAQEKKEQAKDIQNRLTPEEQKKTKRQRLVGAAVDTALTGATGAGIGYGVGKLNEHARKLKSEGRTILGDILGRGVHGIPGGMKAARADAAADKAAKKAAEAAAKGPKKPFWTRVNDNFKENLNNAAKHKFSSARKGSHS